MNNSKKIGAYSESLDQIIAKSMDLDQEKNPDLKNLKYCTIRKGHRTSKVAKYWTIIDRHSGEVHHHGLTLTTFEQTKKNGWIDKVDKSITLDTENENEIQKLFDFIATLTQLEGDGEYTIIRQDDHRISRIIKAINETDQRSELIEQILSWVEEDPSATDDLIELSTDNPERSKSLAAALNYGRYARTLKKFQSLVDANMEERVYQSFLEENYWIFGSEYSELLPNRILTTGKQLDFPLRRTLDGYLEIIEIKRPLNGERLFVGEDHPYERSDLAKAVSQATSYFEDIDRDHYRIWHEFQILADKVRAKVVIGRDGDKSQQEALRRANALHPRVEIITYDQLIKIGTRILQILAGENHHLAQRVDLKTIGDKSIF